MTRLAGDSSRLEGMEEHVSEIERVVQRYLNSSSNQSGPEAFPEQYPLDNLGLKNKQNDSNKKLLSKNRKLSYV